MICQHAVIVAQVDACLFKVLPELLELCGERSVFLLRCGQLLLQCGTVLFGILKQGVAPAEQLPLECAFPAGLLLHALQVL